MFTFMPHVIGYGEVDTQIQVDVNLLNTISPLITNTEAMNKTISSFMLHGGIQYFVEK